jgi:hypothetical protein
VKRLRGTELSPVVKMATSREGVYWPSTLNHFTSTGPVSNCAPR